MSSETSTNSSEPNYSKTLLIDQQKTIIRKLIKFECIKVKLNRRLEKINQKIQNMEAQQQLESHNRIDCSNCGETSHKNQNWIIRYEVPYLRCKHCHSEVEINKCHLWNETEKEDKLITSIFCNKHQKIIPPVMESVFLQTNYRCPCEE